MEPKYEVPEIKGIWSEEGKFKRALEIEIANCEAWYEQGTIPEEDIQVIRGGKGIDWEVYYEVLARTGHDLNALVAAIAAHIDKWVQMSGYSNRPGRWAHFNMTSNDALDSALATQILESLEILGKDLVLLLQALKKRGIEFWNTPIMGRTHGMHAEETTFGEKLANYWYDFFLHQEKLIRLKESWNFVKISGPVGSHEKIPAAVEESIAKALGRKPIPIATQVITRVKILEYLNFLNEFASSVDKVATDIRILQWPEIGEVEEYFAPDDVGSSIMVHKHNPKMSERCVGLSRVIASYVTPGRMDVPLWQERDLTNSSPERIILYDSTGLAVYIARGLTWVVEILQVFPERMKANIALTAGSIRSGKVLNLLVEKGVDRTVARSLISKETNWVWDEYHQGKPMPSIFERLKEELVEKRGLLTEGELASCFDETYDKLFEGVKVSFKRLGWDTLN